MCSQAQKHRGRANDRLIQGGGYKKISSKTWGFSTWPSSEGRVRGQWVPRLTKNSLYWLHIFQLLQSCWLLDGETPLLSLQFSCHDMGTQGVFPGVIFSCKFFCDPQHPFFRMLGEKSIAMTKGKYDQPEVELTVTLLLWTQLMHGCPCHLNLDCSCCLLIPGYWVIFPSYAEELSILPPVPILLFH